MLSVTLIDYNAQCAVTTGGVSNIWLFDRDDFEFTQAAAATDGSLPPYSAVALRTGATATAGAKMFPINFFYQECEYKYNMTKKGASVEYAHEVTFLLPDLSNLITNWNSMVDAAGACHGVGMVIQLFSGKIFVLGEKWVGTNALPEWRIAQDGSSATTGKLFSDVNGQTTTLKGPYKRAAYEFSGGAAAIIALQ